ncbi:MAG TPA: hypothetical protein VFP31_01640 [Gaiellaceae bacterium]|nr:hypothetical protein [Gaiellaceae bacterium]
MNLEHELRGLPIEFPPEPDLTPRVRERLERRSRRPWLILALAAVAAVGALLAIPQTRAAIFDVFHIGGVDVTRVETQPQAVIRDPDLGRQVDFGEAQGRVDFPLVAPDASFVTYYDDSVGGGMVNLAWQGFVLSQWHGDQLRFAQKQVGPSSRTVSVSVNGVPGLWITGARHELIYADEAGQVDAKTRRLVGNVLIWDRDGITYRLEGAKNLTGALAAVRNLQAP